MYDILSIDISVMGNNRKTMNYMMKNVGLLNIKENSMMSKAYQENKIRFLQ